MSTISEKQIHDEYAQLNVFELCHHSQEIVQDLISKTSDALQNIRTLSILFLMGDQNGYIQRRQKLEEIFNTFDIIVKRLRATGSIVHQRKLALEQTAENSTDSMVFENITDTPATTSTTASIDNIEHLKLEKAKLKEELKLKNAYIKLAIDKVNDIIWNINSIQTIKK